MRRKTMTPEEYASDQEAMCQHEWNKSGWTYENDVAWKKNCSTCVADSFRSAMSQAWEEGRKDGEHQECCYHEGGRTKECSDSEGLNPYTPPPQAEKE